MITHGTQRITDLRSGTWRITSMTRWMFDILGRFNPYSQEVTSYMIDTYPDHWSDIKAFGLAHPELIYDIETYPEGWGAFISYYQPVEYIETKSSTVRFTNYGVVGRDFCMKVKLQFVEVGAISGTRRVIFEYNNTYGMGWWFAWSGQSNITPRYTGEAAVQMYEWDVNRPQNFAKLNGSVISSFGSNSTFDAENQVFCFGARENFSSGNKKQRISYLEFYNTQSAIMYPCYRKEDNKIGMFDVINNYFTNFGNGDWVTGNNL